MLQLSDFSTFYLFQCYQGLPYYRIPSTFRVSNEKENVFHIAYFTISCKLNLLLQNRRPSSVVGFTFFFFFLSSTWECMMSYSFLLFLSKLYCNNSLPAWPVYNTWRNLVLLHPPTTFQIFCSNKLLTLIARSFRRAKVFLSNRKPLKFKKLEIYQIPWWFFFLPYHQWLIIIKHRHRILFNVQHSLISTCTSCRKLVSLVLEQKCYPCIHFYIFTWIFIYPIKYFLLSKTPFQNPKYR